MLQVDGVSVNSMSCPLLRLMISCMILGCGMSCASQSICRGSVFPRSRFFCCCPLGLLLGKATMEHLAVRSQDSHALGTAVCMLWLVHVLTADRGKYPWSLPCSFQQANFFTHAIID